MKTYSILVKNEQGATDGKSGLTKQEVLDYLDGWSDLENLSALVRDENGNVVAEKLVGESVLEF